MSLSSVVQFIAGQQGLQPRTVNTEMYYDSVTQQNEDDFAFLYRIARAPTGPDGSNRLCRPSSGSAQACAIYVGAPSSASGHWQLRLEVGANPVSSAPGSELARVVDVRAGIAPARYTESSMATPTGAVQSIAVALTLRTAPPAAAHGSATQLGAPKAVARDAAHTSPQAAAVTLGQQLASLAVSPDVRARVSATLAQARPSLHGGAALLLHTEAVRHTETLAVAFSMRVNGADAYTSLFAPRAQPAP
jgi:hypothetical protein